MVQVEEICNHIALVNKGKKILDGTVKDTKQQYKLNQYKIEGEGLEKVDRITAPFTVISETENGIRVQIKEGNNQNAVLQFLIAQGVSIHAFQELLPSLNEIFIRLVEDSPLARTFDTP